MQGLRPVEASRIASWREHLPRIRAQLLKYPSLIEDLIQAGYEPDGVWAVALEGVEPVWSPRRNRKWLGLRAFETRMRKWWKTRAYLKRLEIGDKG
jgi:hypothetical protein